MRKTATPSWTDSCRFDSSRTRTRPRGLATRAALVLAAATLTACTGGDDADATPPAFAAAGACGATASAAADPGTAGPFGVGYRELVTTYTPPGMDAPRTIPVHVWYPSTVTGDDEVRWRGFFVDTGVAEDGPPAAPLDACGYPLAVFSHGDAGWGGIASHAFERIASHGWVVAAPDHEGNTFDTYEDPRPGWIWIIRPADVSAAIDALDDLGADDPLAGKTATDRAVAIGHSFGTYTMWRLAGAAVAATRVTANCDDPEAEPKGGCSAAELEALTGSLADPRIVGIAPMAGTIPTDWFGGDGYAAVTVPVLSLTGSNDGPDGAGQLEVDPMLRTGYQSS